MVSARSSTSVKPRTSRSGLAARIAGVTSALTTRIAAAAVGPSSPPCGRSRPAPGSRPRRRPWRRRTRRCPRSARARRTGADQHEPAVGRCAAGRRGRRARCAARVRTSRSCSKSQSARSVSVKACRRASRRPGGPGRRPGRTRSATAAAQSRVACLVEQVHDAPRDGAAAGGRGVACVDDRLRAARRWRRRPTTVAPAAASRRAPAAAPAPHRPRPATHDDPPGGRAGSRGVRSVRHAVIPRVDGDDVAQLLAQRLVEHAQRELVRQHRVDELLAAARPAAAPSAPLAQVEPGCGAT